MIAWEAAALGIVQGLTEFLPISSSAHLTLLPKMLGWHTPLLNSLAFDVALHGGTLLGVVLYFRRDILSLVRAWCLSWRRSAPRENADARLAWYLFWATLPAVAAGLAFEETVATIFRKPAWVACWLIVFGVFLGLAERLSRQRKELPQLDLPAALAVGLAQALALMPGVSRSGVTLTAGLALGLKREAAARFSFLLSIPIIAGAFAVKAKDLLLVGTPRELALAGLGAAAAAAAGFVCIRWLLDYLRRGKLYGFVWYRLLLGLVVLFWAWRFNL